MNFKSISLFLDIYHLDKPFQDLLLNYDQIPQGKVIAHIKKIDITILSYETTLSKLVYFMILLYKLDFSQLETKLRYYGQDYQRNSSIALQENGIELRRDVWK